MLPQCKIGHWRAGHMLSPRGDSGSGVMNWKEKQTGSPVRAVLMGIGRGVAVVDGRGVDWVSGTVAPWCGGVCTVRVVTCGWSVPSMITSVSVSRRTCVWETSPPRAVGEGPSGVRGEASVEACGSGSGRASEGPGADAAGGSASSMAASAGVSLNAGSCRGSCVSPPWGALSSLDSLDSADSNEPSSWPGGTCCRDEESQEHLS